VGKLPVLKPRQVIAALEKLGFLQVRQRGSHRQFRHADGRVTTAPDHRGRDISPNLLRKILDDIRVDADDFMKMMPLR
jgi:predicted RNA binding protein YcfA (HicA-like mRNA interferase family)